MKTRWFVFLLFIVSLILPLSTHAQGTFTGFTYQVSFPFSDTKDFAKDVSFRGFGIEARKMVAPNRSVGLAFDWNVFHTVTDEQINLQGVGLSQGVDVDVSGNQNRILNAFPMLLTVHQYMRSQNDGRVPFIGLGIGASYIESRNEIGVIAAETDTWHFTLAPELGIGIQASYDVYTVISVKYNYAFKADDVQHSYIGIKVGLYYF